MLLNCKLLHTSSTSYSSLCPWCMAIKYLIHTCWTWSCCLSTYSESHTHKHTHTSMEGAEKSEVIIKKTLVFLKLKSWKQKWDVSWGKWACCRGLDPAKLSIASSLVSLRSFSGALLPLVPGDRMAGTAEADRPYTFLLWGTLYKVFNWSSPCIHKRASLWWLVWADSSHGVTQKGNHVTGNSQLPFCTPIFSPAQHE